MAIVYNVEGMRRTYKTYTEPKKKLSRDLNGTISTFAFINSFYSYLLLHND